MNIFARLLTTWVRLMVIVMVFLAVVYGVAMAEEQGEEDFFIYLPGIFSAEEAAFCGTQPVLLAPGDGATLDTLNPTFRWTNVNDPDASFVRLELAIDPAFQNIVSITSSGASDGEDEFLYIWENLEPGMVHYWRMNISCNGVDSPYSETRSFTTGSGGTILPAPSLIGPADNSSVTSPVTISWQPVPGAIEYLLIIRYPTGTRYFIRHEDSSIDWFFQNTGESYTWQVAARNDYAIGAFSEERTFTVVDNVQVKPPAAQERPVAQNEEGARLFLLR